MGHTFTLWWVKRILSFAVNPKSNYFFAIAIDSIKKFKLKGFGAGLLTKDRVEEALGGLVEKGKISAK